MGKEKNLGKARKELVDQYDQEAGHLGISRNEYVRKCTEIGRLVFRTSGEVDMERLRNFTESEESVSTDSDLETVDGDLTTAILNNLSTDKNRSLSSEEIRQAVFGTKSEQEDQIEEALTELREAGRITVLVGEEYIKKEENNE